MTGLPSRHGVAPVVHPGSTLARDGACREDESNPNSRGGNCLKPKDQLTVATWNCGGLSHTQRTLCQEDNFDILALTETHDKGNMNNTKNFIRGEAAPPNDSYSGVAFILSDRVAKCVIHSGLIGSRIVFIRIRSSDPRHAIYS